MIATVTGWTWDEIDRLTLPAVYDLDEYWRKYPPVHVLLGGFVEYKAPPRPAARAAGPHPWKIPPSNLPPPSAPPQSTPAGRPRRINRADLPDAPPIEVLMQEFGGLRRKSK